MLNRKAWRWTHNGGIPTSSLSFTTTERVNSSDATECSGTQPEALYEDEEKLPKNVYARKGETVGQENGGQVSDGRRRCEEVNHKEEMK